jgi:diketogulonate reductase-like aldo/keto reductase
MGRCHFLCCRLGPALILAIAILIGWIASTDIPVGTFFWAAQMPMLWKAVLTNELTEEVPTDLKPAPRPTNELFFDLSGGTRMPASGLGLCCRPTAYHQESVKRTVLWYLLQGGRLLDTASLYFNHRAVGAGVQEAIARGIPRSEIFITTKIPPDAFGSNSTTQWVDQMLKELNVSYVDLVLLHAPRPMIAVFAGWWPEEQDFSNYACKTGPACREQTWRALAAARDRGLIKNLGVSNFGIQHFEEFKKSGVLKAAPVAVNQLVYNPWVPQWEKDIVKYCLDNHIVMTGYFSLGGSHSTGTTLDWDAISDIGKKYKKSTAQVLFRWSLQHGVAVIPGTGKPKHMKDNIQLYDFVLTEAEMKKIDKLGAETTLSWTPDMLNPDKNAK